LEGGLSMAVWSVVNNSLVNHHSGRIDAEYYKTESLQAYDYVKKGNYKLLGQLAKEGYRVVYENTKILNPEKVDEQQDVRFLQATNVSDDGLWIESKEIGFVSGKDWVKYPKGRIKHGELLIEVKGQAEKVTIVQDYMPMRTLVTGTLYKLTVDEKLVSPEYIFAYFSCKYGKILRDRTKVNTLISYVSKPELYNIPIPIFEESIDEITSIVRESYRLSILAHSFYHQAEELLAKELQLDQLKLPNKRWYTADYCEVMGKRRFDGEYFQPKYKQIEMHIKAYKKGYSVIKELFYENKSVSTLSKDKYKYIEIGDINNSDGTYAYNTIEKRDLPASAKIELSQGDVLISTVRPYRGAVSIIYDSFSDLIGSSAFTVVREKNGYKKEVLQVLLRLDCYKELLMKWNVGTSYPIIKNNDVMNLVIPMIPENIQIKISELVQQSFFAKQKSGLLLTQAKYYVEELIEQEANKYK